ncbi:MAG: PD-(D/E)XK nuclease family protein [Pseudomonadota bacterium]
MPAGGGPGPDGSAPAWLTAAPVEPVIERRSPSGLTGSDVLLGGAGLGADAARNKGIAIHTLLEHLAPDPASVREQGPALLSARHPEIEDQIAAMAVDEACNALGRPDIAALFGPDTLMELPICVDPPGGGLRMIGRIDMLVLSGRTACVVDIKSDARPPLDPQGVPQKYLAQLGAYASAVRRAWSNRDVRLAIVWTAAPALMDVPLSLAHNAFETANWDARQTAKL